LARVFISYAREDADRVRPLAQALEGAGHDVWWDQHIAGGDQFAHAIEQALNSADVVVAVWTGAGCRSPWVRDEAAAGRDRGILVPVCFDGCVPPLGFRQFQAIDLTRWNGRPGSKALRPLKQAVESKAGAAGVVPGPPQPAIRRAWRLQPRWMAAAAAALAIAVAALFLPRIGLWAGSDSITPKVALGQVAIISPDLPKETARAMHDEIMAAFGAENAVAVTTSDGVGSRSAPFVLDGSIRKDSGALRFTMTLKDAKSGTALWSRGFDRAAADPLAVRQVAVAASEVVRCALWGAASYPRRMPEQALTLYLNFCDEHWIAADEQRQLQAARRVTAALPDFSFGWSALALAAAPLAQGSDREAAALRKEALGAARRASALDELNPEGYMAEALLLPTERFAEREALLEKAISVRPTECGCERTVYGDFLTSVGRFDEAVEQYERAHALRPLSPAVSVRLAQALFVTGRSAEARQTVADMLEVWPDAASLRLLELKSAFWTGDYDNALALLGRPELHLTNDQTDALKAALQALRSRNSPARASAAAKLAEMSRDPRRNDRLLVAALAALGEQAAAIDAAQRLIASRGHMAADVLFEPNLAGASGTADYARVVGRLGLANYWRSTGNLPDVCRGSTRGAYCAAA
jgi:tetratricopeptide (TPR) repeat protein